MPRPPMRYKHIDKVDADGEAKRRLRVLLETLDGTRTAQDAIRELGVSESRFHQLRETMLQGAAAALTRRQGGRPRKQVSPEAEEISRLQAELAQAKQDLEIERLRQDLERLMPGLVNRAVTPKKKRRTRAR